MPSRTAIIYATPRCPGIPTNVTTHHDNHGLAKGTTKSTTSQHLPCDRPTIWNHDAGGWECPEHGPVLSGEQVAAHWTDTLELPAVPEAA
jgi:hypothetical protein